MKDYYSVAEFATILGVTRQTVYQWIYAGEIQYAQVRRKSALRIPASELERIKKQPVPEAMQ